MPAAPYIDSNTYKKEGGYRLIADCLAGKRTREEITKIMEDSALRGLGGAGFPTGRKWKIVAAEPAPRLMAVNIDEGEPGTFKDRYFLERDPHRFLEGMLIAAWCSGVGEIYIYLRDEYAGCRKILEDEIQKLKAKSPAPCRPFLPAAALARPLRLESAMMNPSRASAQPRMRPPYGSQWAVRLPPLEPTWNGLLGARDRG